MAMQDRELYRQLLGLEKPWTVSDVKVDFGTRQVEVFVEWPKGEPAPCPVCGKKYGTYDHRDERRWRHLDTMQFTTVLVCRIPRIECPEHGVKSVAVPWADQKSRYTALFERLAIDILLNTANLADANKLLNLTWDESHQVRKRAVERGLERRDDSEVRAIGVDEKSFGKGQDYVTVVTDLDKHRVLDVQAGRTQESLETALQELPAGIEVVAMDMWKAYEAAVAAKLSNADIVHDRFHVTKQLNKAVDTVRKLEHKELMAQDDTRLKNSKYLWLTNPENMTDAQMERFNALRGMELKVCRARAISDMFRAFWEQSTLRDALIFFTHWFHWATHARLKPIAVAAKTIKNHLPNLLTYIKHRVTNAVSEGYNSKIQLIKAAARGFRNLTNFRIAILFYCGGLDVYPHKSR